MQTGKRNGDSYRPDSRRSCDKKIEPHLNKGELVQENEKKNERNNQRAEDLGCELMQSEEKKPKPHSQKSESKSSSPDNLKVRVSQDGACACAVLFLMLLLLLLVSGYETIGCLGGALFFGVLLIMCAVDVSPRKLRGD